MQKPLEPSHLVQYSAVNFVAFLRDDLAAQHVPVFFCVSIFKSPSCCCAAPACTPAHSISLPARSRYCHLAAMHASTRGISPDSQQLSVCKLHLTANFRGRVTERRRRGPRDACPTRLTARYLRRCGPLHYGARKVSPLPPTHLDSRSPRRTRPSRPLNSSRRNCELKMASASLLYERKEKKDNRTGSHNR